MKSYITVFLSILSASASFAVASSSDPLQWQYAGEAIDFAASDLNQKVGGITNLTTSGNGPSQACFLYTYTNSSSGNYGSSSDSNAGSMYLQGKSGSYLLNGNFDPSTASSFSVDANDLKQRFPDLATGDFQLVFNSSTVACTTSGYFAIEFCDQSSPSTSSGSGGNGTTTDGSTTDGSTTDGSTTNGTGSGTGTGSGSGSGSGYGSGGNGTTGNPIPVIPYINSAAASGVSLLVLFASLYAALLLC